MEFQEFESLQKAIDTAIWNNFKHQYHNDFIPLVVVHGPEEGYILLPEVEQTEMELSVIEIPKDYSNMTEDHIKTIRSDEDPLEHWEKMFGMFIMSDLDILRFILRMKIPIEAIIRHQIAACGIDEKGQWVGFEEAEKIWLNK